MHFGEISPNEVWYKAKSMGDSETSKDLDHFLSELGWREFSYNLLFHFSIDSFIVSILLSAHSLSIS